MVGFRIQILIQAYLARGINVSFSYPKGSTIVILVAYSERQGGVQCTQPHRHQAFGKCRLQGQCEVGTAALQVW